MLAMNRTASWIFMFCLALSLPAAAQTSFKKIVVFGTSLSDPGNAFALVGGTNTPPDYDNDPFNVPNTPYARGGHHFSNGATWIEQFARPIGLAGNVGPAFRGSGGATNYAVGGARAREFGESPTLSVQVGAFLQQFGGSAPSNALYVIEMGGNDLRDALGALLVDPTGGTSFAIVGAALAAINGNIRALHAAGARNFLVWNAPNIGLTPAIAPLGPGVVGFADFLALTFNAGLESEFSTLRSELAAIQIVTLNVYERINGVVLSPDPAEFGFTNVNTACIKPDTAPFACQNADEYFFWDGIHPTKAAHAIIAQTAASVLAP
jgi:phospholipase/lecithinase/hemolysin